MAGYVADLLSNASATGSGVKWPGGPGVFMVDGTFSGATVSLAVLGPDGSSYVALTDWTDALVDFTAEGARPFVAPAGMIKAVVAGGTPSALYAKAIRA